MTHPRAIALYGLEPQSIGGAFFLESHGSLDTVVSDKTVISLAAGSGSSWTMRSSLPHAETCVCVAPTVLNPALLESLKFLLVLLRKRRLEDSGYECVVVGRLELNTWERPILLKALRISG